MRYALGPTMRRLLSLIALATTVLAGCASPASRPGAGGGETTPSQVAPKRLIAAISGEPKTLSQRVSSAGAGGTPGLDALELLFHAGAGRVDDRGVMQPQLAEAIPTVENGGWRLMPDGKMETTWTLKPGVRWHDGTAFTAADLAFTLQ